MGFLAVLSVIAAIYYARTRRSPSGRHVVATLVGVYAAFIVLDGFALAVVEEARARYGVTTSAIILSKISTTGEQGSTTIGRWRRGRRAAIKTSRGFAVHQILARLVLTGTTDAFALDYRYACRANAYACVGRDFLPREQWLGVRPGSTIDVRYVPDGIGSSTPRIATLDLRSTALVEVVSGGVLMLLAAIAGGAIGGNRRKHYLEAPATVLGVASVQYKTSLCWRVRFGFIDRMGEPHEITDEYVTTTWKAGDAGIVQYDAANPRDAVLRPVEGV